MAETTISSDYIQNSKPYEHFIPADLSGTLLINPTDAYSSYTYRLTFSMLPYTFYSTPEVDLDTTKPSSGRIIIAQTSVTKFQIDDLEISSVVHSSPPAKLKGNRTSKYLLNFTLREPLGMSFIDLLNRTAYQLNKNSEVQYPSGGTPPLQTMPYLLEIELIGQEDGEVENPDSSKINKFGETFYHTAIPMRVIDFDIDPGVQGTMYNIKAVPITEIDRGAKRSIKQIPRDMTIESDKGTVEELLASLSDQMQKEQKAETDSNDEEYGVELGLYKLADEGLPGHPDIFKDGLPIDPEYLQAGLATKDLKKLPATLSQVEENDESGQADEGNDGKDNKVRFTIKKGTLISRIMKDLAGLNSDYINTTIRFKMAKESAQLDPSTHVPEKTQTLTPTLRTSYKWPDQKFTKTHHPAYTYIYELTGKLDSSIVVDTSELEVDGETEKTESRVAAKNRNICKSYGYFYTGINDQVLDVDLKIEHGVRYLATGYGGKQANYTMSDATAISKAAVKSTADAEKKKTPIDETGILDKFAQIGKDIKAIITDLKNLPQKIAEDLSMLATGLSPIGVSKPDVNNVRKINMKLPSSPISIITNSATIKDLTGQLDDLTESIDDLQDSIQGEISEILDSQIAEIMSKAFVPFDVIDSGLNKIAEGVGGFIDKIEDAVGDLELEQFGIDPTSMLDEARDKVDKFVSEASTTPPGFSTGDVMGSVTSTTSTNEFSSQYMEELEFDDTAMGYNDFAPDSVFGEYDTNLQEFMCTPASKYANKSIFSTMLSNSSLGAPYLVRTALTIKGDPYWLGRETVNDNKKFVHVKGKEFLGEFEHNIGEVRTKSIKENIAPYGLGEVCFYFAYLFPREYDHWSDDSSRHTGEMKDLSMDKSFSGQFCPYRVTHMFSGGFFKQNLEAFRITYRGQYPYEHYQKAIDKARQDEADKASEEDAKTLTSNVSQDLSNELESRLGLQGNPSGIIPGTGVRGTRPSNTTGQTSGYNGPGPGGGGNNPAFDPGA